MSMSGMAFIHIAEAIRSFLRIEDIGTLRDIYRPLDEGGLDFISLDFLEKNDFESFFYAAHMAFDEEQRQYPESQFKQVWNELFERLSADPRFGE